MYLGSDALALSAFTDTITYLEDDDWVILRRGSAVFRGEDNEIVVRAKVKTQASAFLVDKGNHRHFMAKEIHEQPEVVARTLAHYIDFATGAVRLPFALPFDAASLTGITITACGTAYYAAMIAKYWFERFARLRVEIDVASEFRYREAPLPEQGVMIVVSQSGETADTLPACVTPRRMARRLSAWSMSPHRPSRGRPMSPPRLWPARKSASPRPRPLLAS